MNLRSSLGTCLIAIGLLILPAIAQAQTTGTIRGSVKDPSGAVIPGAPVTATTIGTDTTRSATTDADGTFEFVEMPVAHYTISIAAPGFKNFIATDVAVDIGRVAIVNSALEVGAAQQTVTVEGAAAQVETTSTQLGAVMTDVAVTELPLSTRNTYELLQLQPGVQSQLGADLFYGSDSPGVVSVNGGRGRANNYMVNGGDGNDIFVNSPAIQPSPVSIDEFRVLTNTFDAEYGRNSGSVVNVITKSGTNQVHGDFYEFIRNDALNTRGYFDPEVPDYKQNQFGATLGGPIHKDKTFIFGSYEGDRLRQGIPSGAVTLPTAAEAAGNYGGQTPFFGNLPSVNTSGVPGADFSSILANRHTGGSTQSCQQAVTALGGGAITPGAPFSSIFPTNVIPSACFDPDALSLYNAYVRPVGTGTISSVPVRDERGDQFTIRFDHHITNAQLFSAYYFFDDDNRLDPFSNFQAAGANVPGFGGLFKTRTQQWNLSHTWTIGTNMVNEFRFNYFREGQKGLNHPQSTFSSIQATCPGVSASECFTAPGLSQYGITTNLPGRVGVPSITVPGGFSIGNNFEGELPQVGNTFQWTDNFSRIFGKHSVKFGVDVRRERFDQFLYYNINGEFGYLNDGSDGVGSDDSYPNYFLGLPNTYSQGAAQGENIRNTEFYTFVQDSWKIKPSVTLNYGIRWELNTPYYDNGNRLQTFRPGAVNTQYPCYLSPTDVANLGIGPNCNPSAGANNASVYPLGLEFPNDPGVPRGLTTTYYKAFAPRIGLAWSPDYSEGWLGKLFGGPGKSSIRAGYGIFYNPIEQLVLEQFSAEPPFGGSTALSNTLFDTPFLLQDGTPNPNPFAGVLQQTPQKPCPYSGGPTGCVDWAQFRPILLFGEFQPHLKTQYSDQYNLTLQRELAKDLILSVGYVGTQGHHLLASHDLNAGNQQTCLDLINISNFYATSNPTLSADTACGPFGSDSQYTIPAGAIPAGMSLHLPYGSTPVVTGPNNPAINLVGIRPYSSPLCQPTTGVGCPPDGVPVFSNIFAEDTISNSNYNALQISLSKSYSHGLLFEAAYTYSKSIDYGSSFESELNPDHYSKSRGLSLFDARHRFVFSPYWALPIPKMGGFAGKIANGWGVSAIITYQTGFPIRFFSGDDTELQSSFFFESAGQPEITGKVHFLNPKTNNGFYFATNNINDSAPGTYGNSPHALCCGPAINNSDIMLNKKTRISERFDTEFRAEFYNAWNHTQFNNPDGDFSDTTFGQILKARDPRVIQFALKVLF